MILFIGGSIIGYTQSNFNYEKMVGFGCGFGGELSRPVKKVSKLIDKEKYNEIIKLLDSDNNAERFLAVVVCEKLSELKKLIISNEMKNKISIAYKSNAFVSVCSGCTYWDNLTLKNMLEAENSMRTLANSWIEDKFQIK